MGRIYQTELMGDAHIRVALVSRGDADLLVHRVDSFGMARGDEHWFITRDKQSAGTRVFFTTPGFAEVKVCFVGSSQEAGWQKESPYRNRFR